MSVGNLAPLVDEELCRNLEELASDEPEVIYTEDCYFVEEQTEKDVYRDSDYIDFQRKQPPVTLREKRDYVKGELLETEGKYVETLTMLKKKFMKPLLSLLKEEDWKIIFFGIKELSGIHTGFLRDLNLVLTATSSPSMCTPGYAYGSPPTTGLEDCFARWKEKFVIYGDYCVNLTRAQNRIDELTKKNDTLNHEIAKCEKEANCGRFKLRDWLSVPMRRVVNYQLLLQKLLDETSLEAHGHDEYKSTEKARDAMFDVAQYANEVKRDSETLTMIRQIQDSIYDLKMPPGMELKDYGRLQKDGELWIRSHDDNRLKSRYVFVFDKVMLMCKTKKGEKYSYKDSLCLQEYRVEDVPPGTMKKTGLWEPHGSDCWNLVHYEKKNVYTMYAQTEEQKRCWIKAIEDALTNIQPEECRSENTKHLFGMHTFERGAACTYCHKLMKGLFFQGYKCGKCCAHSHRECLSLVQGCRVQQPPALPPRLAKPPLLRILNHLSADSALVPKNPSQARIRMTTRRLISIPSSPQRPLRNLNSHSCTLTRMRLSASQPPPEYVDLNRLENYQWYVGEMDRGSATTVLDQQPNGTFLARIRPAQIGVHGVAAYYALSLKWNDQVKHMKVLFLTTAGGETRYYLSISRYFKSVVELVSWYSRNSLAESFSGLDACLERPFDKVSCGSDNYVGSNVRNGASRSSPAEAVRSTPLTPVPGSPS